MNWVEIVSICVTIITVVGGALVAFHRITSDIRNETQDNINTAKNELKEDIKRVEDKIEKLVASFTSVGINKLVADKSPLSLTQKGKEVLAKCNGRGYLENHLQDIYKEFEGITNNYDIQKKAKDVLQERKDEIENELKEYLYQGGVLIDDAIEVMAIELRDMVIRKKEYKQKIEK